MLSYTGARMGDMAETTRRLLRLLSLLEAQAVWSGPELAERLAVTTRTVRRDVERLREIGYPVMADQGIGGGYRLGSGRKLPPLVLDDDEAVAVAVSLKLATMSSVEGLNESAVRTLSKLDQVLPARLQTEVAALDEAMVTVSRQVADVPPQSLMMLARCIRDGVRTRFGYESHTGISTDRDVEPYRLVATGRRWYLLAYDLEREDWRTFRVDRIREPRASTFRFRRREEPDAAEYVQRAVQRAARPVSATVRVAAPHTQVRPLVHHGEVRRVDPLSTEVTAHGEDLRSLAWYFCWLDSMLDAELQVVDPPELATEFDGISRRITGYTTGR